MNTAGWRGPWAAPPSSGESPRGTLIPGGRMSPPSRVRPRGAEVSTVEQVQDLLTPEGMGSALSPLCWPQHWQGQTDKHTWNTTITTYYRVTLCTSTQTTARTRKRARAVSGGGREEAAEPNYPPAPTCVVIWTPQIANPQAAIAELGPPSGRKSQNRRPQGH